MEFQRKCKICGKIYCYTNEDISDNQFNNVASVISAIGTAAAVLGGGSIFQAAHLSNQTNYYDNKKVDFNRCPYCGSTNTEPYYPEKDPQKSIDNNSNNAEASIASKEILSGRRSIEINSNATPESLITRAMMFLEDEEWENADAYAEACLDIEPQNANAYVVKLLVELKITNISLLKNSEKTFDSSKNYQKAVRFGDAELKSKLEADINHILERNECARKDAVLAQGKASMNRNTISDLEQAIKLFESISGWKDADNEAYNCKKKIEELKAKAEAERLERERKAEAERKEKERKAKAAKKAMAIWAIAAVVIAAGVLIYINVIAPMMAYNSAVELMNAGSYEEAITAFENLNGYKDSTQQIENCNVAIKDIKYNNAVELMDAGKYKEAAIAMGELGQHAELLDLSKKIWHNYINPPDVVSVGNYHTVGLKSDGTVIAIGENEDGQCNVSDWKDIVAVFAGDYHTIGLKSDGTVIATGKNKFGQCDVSDWKDIKLPN